VRDRASVSLSSNGKAAFDDRPRAALTGASTASEYRARRDLRMQQTVVGERCGMKRSLVTVFYIYRESAFDEEVFCFTYCITVEFNSCQ
jgi:hypothetical protein